MWNYTYPDLISHIDKTCLNLIILVGVPASGKTTLAKNLIATYPSANIVRVNRDDIRKMICRDWSSDLEKLVVNIRNASITNALISNYSVIVDDTNLDDSVRNDMKNIVQEFVKLHNKKVKITTYVLDRESIVEYIRRDDIRKDTVGKEVVLKMYEKLQKNRPDTTFEYIESKTLNEEYFHIDY